jgi:uncharacterized protein YdaU (DUF1376 family)
MPPKGRKKKKTKSAGGSKQPTPQPATPQPVNISAAAAAAVTNGERILSKLILSHPEEAAQYEKMIMQEYPHLSANEARTEMAKCMNEMEREEELQNMSPNARSKFKKKERKQESSFCDEKKCQVCEKTKSSACQRCKCRYYCSKECQVQDWQEFHKQECKVLDELRTVPQIPQGNARDFEDTAMGLVSTKEHGHYFVVLDQYRIGEARWVPLASRKLMSEEPSRSEILKCLKESMLHPRFDTHTGGCRRPYSVTILAGTPQAERLAALCFRLQMVVKTTKDPLSDSKAAWFYAQMGWNEDIERDPRLTNAVSVNERVPIPPDGLCRLELAERFQAWNQEAVKEAPRDFPSLGQVLPLSTESFSEVPTHSLESAWLVGVHEGVLYIFTQRLELLYCARVPLDPTTRRPSMTSVLGSIYTAIVGEGMRPAATYLGQPSICSCNDVASYEAALNGTVVRDNCCMSSMNVLELQLKEQFVPHWQGRGSSPKY